MQSSFSSINVEMLLLFCCFSGRNQDGVYGSLPSSSVPDPGRDGKSIIYCVHGKPSGCCLVTKAEVVESTTFGVPLSE